ncbi:MAG TPA: hypothetical protein VLN08_15565, partial [Vicinamibacterales bacterium]|nr:hypothetical protein [Vicinamibacterales bacterium]
NVRQQTAQAGAARPGGAAGGATAGQLRQRFDSVDLNRAAAARDRGVVREANRPNLGALRQQVR